MSKHQKNIVTVNGSIIDDSRLQEHITEALKMPSNTARFIGTITHGPDHAGTTIFVTSGGRQFLAFVDLKNPVKLGDVVTFRISGLRATDLTLEPTTVLEQEAAAELEPPTAMAHAFLKAKAA
jgi:hypothetical protein